MASTVNPDASGLFVPLVEGDPAPAPQWPRIKRVAILATVLGLAGTTVFVFYSGSEVGEVSEPSVPFLTPLLEAPLDAFAMDYQEPKAHSTFPTEVADANHLVMNDPEHAKELLRISSSDDRKALMRDYLAMVGTGKPHPGSERRHNYDTLAEFNHRLQVFQKSIEDIIELNIKSRKEDPSTHRARFAIGIFADWTEAEFRSLNTENTTEIEKAIEFLGERPAPVTPVFERRPACSAVYKELGPAHQQGHCGSCWAHATVGTLRTCFARKYGHDPGDLSPQFMIDCDPDYMHSRGSGCVKGCCGGNRIMAWYALKKLGGVPTIDNYPDTSDTRPTTPFPCKSSVRRVATCDGPITMSSEYEMSQNLCNIGGLSVGVWASGPIMHYRDGAIPASACHPPGKGRTNHAVEAIGLDAYYPGGGVWIIRNSWGTRYGVARNRPYNRGGGNFLLRYGQDTCSIASGHPSTARNVQRL